MNKIKICPYLLNIQDWISEINNHEFNTVTPPYLSMDNGYLHCSFSNESVEISLCLEFQGEYIIYEYAYDYDYDTHEPTKRFTELKEAISYIKESLG